MAVLVTAIDGMTSHDAADASAIDTAFISQEGVIGLTAKDLQVEAQAVPDMTVKVNDGSCYVLRDAYVANDNTLKHWHVIVTADTNVTIPTADPANDRIDLICVKIDTGASPDATASNVATLVNVEGTPAGSPTAPAVPNNHLKLAEVAVGAGVTSISGGNITDSREYIGLALPHTEGYRFRDTGGNIDARVYEDTAGNIIMESPRSGGGMRVNPVSEVVQAKGKTADAWTDVIGLSESNAVFSNVAQAANFDNNLTKIGEVSVTINVTSSVMITASYDARFTTAGKTHRMFIRRDGVTKSSGPFQATDNSVISQRSHNSGSFSEKNLAPGTYLFQLWAQNLTDASSMTVGDVVVSSIAVG